MEHQQERDDNRHRGEELHPPLSPVRAASSPDHKRQRDENRVAEGRPSQITQRLADIERPAHALIEPHRVNARINRPSPRAKSPHDRLA